MERNNNSPEDKKTEIEEWARHHTKPRFGITPEKLREEKIRFVEGLQVWSDKEPDPELRTKIFNEALDLLNDLTKDVKYPATDDDYDNGL
jgi:hypothetical protein